LFSCAIAAIGATASAIAVVSAVNFSDFWRRAMRSSMSGLWRLRVHPDLPGSRFGFRLDQKRVSVCGFNAFLYPSRYHFA
jgi:1,4-alpha-glucan branching enzyme